MMSPITTDLDDAHWLLMVSEDDLQKAEVNKIHLCALRNELNQGEDGQPPTNHWVVCLETSPGSCVMLDMAPGYGEDGLRGQILVTAFRGCTFTDEALRTFTYDCRATKTASEILHMIQDKGRHSYTFSPEWEGCRYWISVVMDDLEAEGILDTGASKDALEHLSQYWVCPEGSQPREMRKGRFS
ncbi:hypothetical protein PG997_000219 [Apiospora hydei]|uniref:DUF7770 domain-containing protein n=1 Tax=Apiospora hydei TaxID=1337664 RepID=A0ABR1XA40_9PEZI